MTPSPQRQSVRSDTTEAIRRSQCVKPVLYRQSGHLRVRVNVPRCRSLTVRVGLRASWCSMSSHRHCQALLAPIRCHWRTYRQQHPHRRWLHRRSLPHRTVAMVASVVADVVWSVVPVWSVVRVPAAARSVSVIRSPVEYQVLLARRPPAARQALAGSRPVAARRSPAGSRHPVRFAPRVTPPSPSSLQ